MINNKQLTAINKIQCEQERLTQCVYIEILQPEGYMNQMNSNKFGCLERRKKIGSGNRKKHRSSPIYVCKKPRVDSVDDLISTSKCHVSKWLEATGRKTSRKLQVLFQMNINGPKTFQTLPRPIVMKMSQRERTFLCSSKDIGLCCLNSKLKVEYCLKSLVCCSAVLSGN